MNDLNFYMTQNSFPIIPQIRLFENLTEMELLFREL